MDSGDSHASLFVANIVLWNWGTGRGKVRKLLRNFFHIKSDLITLIK